jgi:homoserine O-acetyltransferase
MRFPIITIGDMVHAQRNLITYLGVNELAMVAGWSIGGQQALEWAMSYPNLVRKVIVVAAGAAKGPQAVAFSEVQRQAIMADPEWLSGDYTPGQGPVTGLAIARMMATITYQSEEAMELRFSRNSVQRNEYPSPTFSPDLGGRFDIENYLYYQGAQLAKRFDANSYLYISRAADLYDVSEGYPSLDAALCHISSKVLFVGIRSDILMPAAHVRWLADKARSVGVDAAYVELDSPYGHDACLKEWHQLAEVLRQI